MIDHRMLPLPLPLSLPLPLPLSLPILFSSLFSNKSSILKIFLQDTFYDCKVVPFSSKNFVCCYD